MNNTSTASGQRNIILKHLEHHTFLTTQYARDQLCIPHPAGRICELRGAGHNIITHRSIEHTLDGKPHRMAKYVLVSGGEK